MQRSIRITNELQELTLLNELLSELLGDFCIPSADLMHFRLAVEEAVVNCIMYAYPGEQGREIVIGLDCSREALRAVITDCGVAFDPTLGSDPDISLPAEERPVGGLGRFLARKLMTRVSYIREDGRNVLVLVKELT